MLVWTGGGPNNPYGNFSVGPRHAAKTYLAYRVSFFLAYGPISKQVCHTCDNTGCVNPAHLFAGTQKDNRQDCKNKGRVARGSSHGLAKVNEFNVLKIVELFKCGKSRRDIADQLNVSVRIVEHICAGRTWSWLTGITPPESS